MHNPEQNAVLLDGTAPLSARSRPHSASNKSRPNSANNASRSNSRPNSANATSSARLQPSQKANDDDEMMLSIDEEEINPISNQNELKSNKLRVSKILQHRQANISEDEEEAREGVIFADVRKSTDPTTNKRRPVSASNAVRSSSTSNAIAANRNNNKADHRGSRSHSALPSPKPNIKQNNSNVAITRDGSGFKVTLSTEPNHAASNPPSSSPKRDNDPKYWLYEQPQQQQQQAVGAYEDPVSNQEYEAPPRPVMQPVHAAPNYYLYANADNIATPADLSSAVHVMQPAYAQQSTNKSTDAVDGTRVKNTYGYYSLPFDKAPYFPTGQTPFVVIPAANFMQPYPNAQYNPAPHWQQQVAQPQVAPSYYYSEQGIQSQHQQQVQPRDTFVEVKRQQLPQTRIQSSTFQDADEAMSPLRYDSNAHRQVQEPPPPSEVNRSPQLAIDTPPKYAYGSDNSPSSLAPMELSQSFSPFSPLHMASMDFESPMQPVR